MKPLVSIIMPAYNNQRHVAEAIQSVIDQTLTEWELLVIDDGSKDNTAGVAEAFAGKDPRVILFRQPVNAGAAKARNTGLEHARGRFIAYLDADDKWHSDKLQKQVAFMTENAHGFSCTSYEVIDDEGRKLDKEIFMLNRVDYMGFLLNNLLQTVGIMVDTSVVNKRYLVMPNLRRRQDAATWLQVLKSGTDCYGMREILAQYRRTKGSLSSNKLKAVKGVWFLYRRIEHLGFVFSCRCLVKYAVLALRKRIYHKHRAEDSH